VFIATRGAASYKFGAVVVSIFAQSAIETITTGCRDFENALMRLAPDWKKADEEERAADGGSRKATAFLSAFPDFADSTSASIYFAFLPLPLAETETDADGRFKIDVPINGDFVAAAIARRDVDGIHRALLLVSVGSEDAATRRAIATLQQ
jgi:hypothetical protein